MKMNGKLEDSDNEFVEGPIRVRTLIGKEVSVFIFKMHMNWIGKDISINKSEIQ